MRGPLLDRLMNRTSPEPKCFDHYPYSEWSLLEASFLAEEGLGAGIFFGFISAPFFQ